MILRPVIPMPCSMPTRSIANATKINAVVVNGLLLDRKALDRMEAQMKADIRTAPPAVGFGDVR